MPLRRITFATVLTETTSPAARSFSGDPRRAVHAIGVLVRSGDLPGQLQQSGLPRAWPGGLSGGPVVVARAGHLEQFTHPRHRRPWPLHVGLLHVDHCERGVWFDAFSTTKKAAAFFRNSRSIRSCAFSARSRSNSARSLKSTAGGTCDHDHPQADGRERVRLPDPAGRRPGCDRAWPLGLASYYSAKGEAPGVWVGRGLSGLEGLAAGDGVTEEQMRNLFGSGRHPLAEQLREAAAQAGLDAAAADRTSWLGNLYPVYANDVSEFRRRGRRSEWRTPT
jgi:hypothetical protein